jgi:LPS export ABC transporter protein LptC
MDKNGPSPAARNWRQLGALAAILLFALAGLNFRWPTTITSRSPAAGQESDIPDIIIDRPNIDEFGPGGQKIRQLQGLTLQHFDKAKRSEITAPRVQFEQKDKEGQLIPWQLQSDTAVLFHDSGKVDLFGNAVLWSDATAGGKTEIRSELIHVDTARQFAETDKAVTIRARRSETTSIGLKADLTNERLLLPMRVKEIHEARR